MKRSNTSISSTHRPLKSSLSTESQTKTMRFFGDTDLDSTPKSYSSKSRDHSPAGQANHKSSHMPSKSSQANDRKAVTTSMFNLNRVNLCEIRIYSGSTYRMLQLLLLHPPSSPPQRADSSESISADEKHDHRYHSTNHLEKDEYTVPRSPYLGSRRHQRLQRTNGHHSRHDSSDQYSQGHWPTFPDRNGRSSSETRALPSNRPRKPPRDLARRRAMSQ